MAIIIDREKRVLVQGITGREGRARTKLMREFGTSVVAGCTPGKGGQDVEGVPVFDRVAEAVEAVGGVELSVVFVPARLVKSAAVEAIEAGVERLLLVPDRVPLWDAMAIAEVARAHGASFIGPNTLGVISPGKGVIGMIGGRAASAREWFNEPRPGCTVGVISRSGGMTSSCGYYLSRRGVSLSTLVHVGGDSVIGLPIPDIALLFENDPETDALVIFGEIGGSQEERLAEHMAAGRVTKPVVAYIGGKALPINVDGAIGAILADLGFEPEVMNGIFMIGRCAGLIAHVREEQTRMRPMRRVDPVAHTYDGPAPRAWPRPAGAPS